MAEVKNTFTRSKMNKDLDDRLIPNGEYRHAKNISISRSEDSDVGTVENILGNKLLTDFGLTSGVGLVAIGHYMDVVKERIYVFLTNYTDTSIDKLSNNSSNSGDVECYIVYYDIRTDDHKTLISGSWLNFSKTHPITGINIIEDLLFWTDDRNQPRKINVETAILPGNDANSAYPYYTNEDHISVAKYYPFKPIDLYKKQSDGTLNDWNEYISTMKDANSEYLPIHTARVIQGTQTNNYLDILGLDYNIAAGSKITGEDIIGDCIATSIDVDAFGSGYTRVHFPAPQATQTTNGGKIVYFQSPNPDYNANWPGNPRFLKDKFVRFSYRFKFDDGEYSLIAPFTQIAFVPKQDGYFINTDLKYQEDNTYKSTVVKFMENKVNDITLIINGAEDESGTINFKDLFTKLKATEIDVLYKESDGVSIKVLDTIKREEFEAETSGVFEYNYQSRKPWKTLPEKEITRVWDKVPIKALSQETAGNRVIYGNYVDKHTSPTNLNYTVQIDDKPNEPTSYVRKEYQNHTLKQNRTYQVGIVLSDRYGRQSNVILSDIKPGVNITEKDSTIFHSYKPDGYSGGLITSGSTNNTWPGDMLSVWFHDTIPSSIGSSYDGYPGIYASASTAVIGLTEISSGSGYSATTLSLGGTSTLPTQNTVSTLTTLPSGIVSVIPGDTLTVSIDSVGSNGDITGISIDNPGSGYNNGDIITINEGHGNATYSVTIADPNPLGWYSYKVVVKQTEQEYYNVYLPGMLNAYPRYDFDDGTKRWTSTTDDEPPEFTTEINQTAHVVLINDNINKVPRDLKEVGPDEGLYRSSVILMGRVENLSLSNGEDYNPMSNHQYYPDDSDDTVSIIGKMTELTLGGTTVFSPQLPKEFYRASADPLIAQISTDNAIGLTSDAMACPYLSIYETKPVESRMELFWETSTSGLISELNYNIENIDSALPTDITEPNISAYLVEGAIPGSYCSAIFHAINVSGASLAGVTTIEIIEVSTGLFGTTFTPTTSPIELEEQSVAGTYRLKTKTGRYFLSWENQSFRTWKVKLKVIRTSDNLVKYFDVQGEVTNSTPSMIGKLGDPDYSEAGSTYNAKIQSLVGSNDGEQFWNDNQNKFFDTLSLGGYNYYAHLQGASYETQLPSGGSRYNLGRIWHRYLTRSGSNHIYGKTYYPTTTATSNAGITSWGSGNFPHNPTGYDIQSLRFEAVNGSYPETSNAFKQLELTWEVGKVVQHGAYCFIDWAEETLNYYTQSSIWRIPANTPFTTLFGKTYVSNKGWWRVMFKDDHGLYLGNFVHSKPFILDFGGVTGGWGNQTPTAIRYGGTYSSAIGTFEAAKDPNAWWPGIPTHAIDLSTSYGVDDNYWNGGSTSNSSKWQSIDQKQYPGQPWDFDVWHTNFQNLNSDFEVMDGLNCGLYSSPYTSSAGNTIHPFPGGSGTYSTSGPIGFDPNIPDPWNASSGTWVPNTKSFYMETDSDNKGILRVSENYPPGVYQVEVIARDRNGSGYGTDQTSGGVAWKESVMVEILPESNGVQQDLGDYRDVNWPELNSSDNTTGDDLNLIAHGRKYLRPQSSYAPDAAINSDHPLYQQ